MARGDDYVRLTGRGTATPPISWQPFSSDHEMNSPRTPSFLLRPTQDEQPTPGSPPTRKQRPISASTISRATSRSKYIWFVEAGFLIISALAIVTTVIVLRIFDGHTIPKWASAGQGLSLNSILSILSTISRSSLMIPLDEALGQLMWLSFAKKSRMLSEVELFNQASRGPWGAMVLIWKRRGMGITSLGCILMIVAVGLGFTQQQLISYPTVIKFIPDVENLTLVGTSPTFYDSYQETANLTSPGSVDPTVEFRVWASFLSYLNHYVPHDPLYRCDSGNCIYPDFNTLAVCSECLHLENKDIQQECDDDSDSCSAQHDNLEAFAWKRAQQGAYSTIVNQTADTSIPTSIVETKTMSVNFTNWPPEYRFDSCSVKWCVQTISSNVTNSTYYETEKYSSTLFDILSNNSVLFHGTSSNNSPYSFTVSEKSQIAFKRLGDMLTGWSRSTSQEEWLHSSSLFNGIAAFATADMTVGGKHMHRHKGTPVEVMTSGMSDALRGSLDVVGLRVLRETIVRVRWWWVLYPMAMWILSAVFLVGVVIETRQNEHIVGAWGCSAIALMLWGVEEDAKERVMDWSAEGLNKKAEKVRMQLFREGEGWSMKSVNEEGMGY